MAFRHSGRERRPSAGMLGAMPGLCAAQIRGPEFGPAGSCSIQPAKPFAKPKPGLHAARPRSLHRLSRHEPVGPSGLQGDQRSLRWWGMRWKRLPNRRGGGTSRRASSLFLLRSSSGSADSGSRPLGGQLSSHAPAARSEVGRSWRMRGSGFETTPRKGLNPILTTDQTPPNRTRPPFVDRLGSSRQATRESRGPERFAGWSAGKSRVTNHEKGIGEAARSVSVLK